LGEHTLRGGQFRMRQYDPRLVVPGGPIGAYIMRNKIDVTIWSLEEITRKISEWPTEFNIVSIRSSDVPPKLYGAFEKHRRNYKNIIVECFDDLTLPRAGLIMPSHEHIQRILMWTKGKDKIAVHCTAGISRSAAVAYLIACQQTSPKKALGLFEPAIHCPNRLILELGVEILKDESVLSEYTEWFERTYGQY